MWFCLFNKRHPPNQSNSSCSTTTNPIWNPTSFESFASFENSVSWKNKTSSLNLRHKQKHSYCSSWYYSIYDTKITSHNNFKCPWLRHFLLCCLYFFVKSQFFPNRIEANKQTPGIMDIQKQAMMSGGSERLSGPQSSKALLPTDSSKLSSSAIVQKRALTMPKPEWHAPWKLMRVSIVAWKVSCNCNVFEIYYRLV